MKRTGLGLVVSALLVLGAGLAQAAEMKFSGLVFSQFRHYLTDTTYTGVPSKDVEDFSVTRIYLGTEATINDALRAKILLEGNTITAPIIITGTAGTPSNLIFIKNAYVEYVNLYPGANLSLGVVVEPWLGYEEKIWGHRYVQKTFGDIEGLLNAADNGVSLIGTIPAGFGDYHLTYANGEGVKAMEKSGMDGRYKDGMGRLSVCPLPMFDLLKGFKVHGFYQLGQVEGSDIARRDRSLAAVSYESGLFNVMGIYVWTLTGDKVKLKNVRGEGCSAHASVNLPLNFGIFARYDWMDADREDIDNTSFYRTIFGVDYKLADGVKISVNDQITTPAVQTASRQPENQLLVQMMASF